MKIRPTSRYIKSQISQTGEVVLLLGVRREESSARAQRARFYDNGGRLNPHNDVKGCWVYRPVLDMTTDEVWTVLIQRRPPWGGTHRDLVTLYRNAQGGECPFVVDQDDAPSCGTSSSRFGCWTCTVVDKDNSLQGFIDIGFDHLEPLAEFRDWIQAFSRDFDNRMTERRNGQAGVGPFKPENRRLILDRLLGIQQTIQTTLISEAEIARIHAIWSEDECRSVLNKANRLLSILDS